VSAFNARRKEFTGSDFQFVVGRWGLLLAVKD
jgi:hypothetical protein